MARGKVSAETRQRASAAEQAQESARQQQTGQSRKDREDRPGQSPEDARDAELAKDPASQESGKGKTFEVLQPVHVAREGSAKGVVRIEPGHRVHAKSKDHPLGLDEAQAKRLKDLGVIK